jgi:3D-(3,5/4)-trihydroxycyclohexane-1,2-dione acylhydrolase (decyclizing)
MTTAGAIVRYLIAQRTVIDERDVPLFPGVYAIFGHGNVTSLGLALQEAGDALPTWRGQNEQGMGLAAAGFAKAANRRQIMVATSSIGPGALNMVTAAGVRPRPTVAGAVPCRRHLRQPPSRPGAAAGRALGDPTITVNDAFKSVSRYWTASCDPSRSSTRCRTPSP